MVADASIYGILQQQKDPLDSVGKALNLRALMDESKLRGLQTTKAERDLTEDEELRKVFSGAAPGASLESLLPDVYRASPKAGVEFQGKMLTQRKTQADLDKTTMEMQGKAAELHRNQLADVNDPQTAAAWVQAGYEDPNIGPVLKRGGTLEQAVARIPQDPAQFNEWKQRNGLGIQKFMEMQNANAEHRLNRAQTAAGQAETQRHNTATETQAASTAAETVRHHGALEGDPATIENTAKAIAEGRLAPLSGFALSRPMAQNIMSRVVEINPDFDPTQFATRQKAEKDFATGKQGQGVKSFNVAISHLGTLDQVADALHNGNMQLFNKLGNTYASQTGGTAPTDFSAVKKIVADEIVKAIVGSGGGVADREEAAKTIDAMNSPQQLKGVIGRYKELMKGQLDGLRKQYEATTGKTDFDKKFMSDEARAVTHPPAAAAAAAKPGGAPLVPAKGAVQDGHRFKGGDPAKRENWEPV